MRFLTFWSINDALDVGRLTAQLDDFVAAGLDGVVFHPRFFPDQPAYLSLEYLDIVSEVILAARDRGLAFWVYDENGWPSGTVGGEMLQQRPDLRQQWLALEPGTVPGALATHRDGDETLSFVVRHGEGVDYLAPDLGEQFLQQCYETYRDGLSPAAWAHVEAFFDDEPEFGLGHAYDLLPVGGAVPWTGDLVDRVMERHGLDLIDALPLLFHGGEGADQARLAFWETASDLLVERYLRPIDRWCRAEGKVFTAHLKGEEHPLFQVPTMGSNSQVLQAVGMPGIDALERFPSNDYYPRQAASVARQFGTGRTMAEAFGGAGWGASPADLERYLLWLARCGVTDVVLHLSQYRLDSAALQDWPPSLPRHMTWADAFPEVLRRVRAAAATGSEPPSTLVISPHRGTAALYAPSEFVQTNVHDGSEHPDTPAARLNASFMTLVTTLGAAGVDVDYTDERTLASATRQAEGLRLGHAVYSRVVVAEGARLDDRERTLLDGLVVPVPPVPTGSADRPAQSTAPGEDLLVPAAQWQLLEHPVNDLPLDVEQRGGRHVAEFSSEAALEVTVVLADHVAWLRLDGRSVTVTAGTDGDVAHLGLVGPGRHQVEFAAPALLAWAWLRGRFRVDSPVGFTPGPDGTLAADGPFVLSGPRASLGVRVGEDGFPFLRDPLHVHAAVSLATSKAVALQDGLYDAARLTAPADGSWVWPRDRSGSRTELGRVSSDTARVGLALVGSTYNVFGPHHYYRGDHSAVSPDQIRGQRNFLEPAGAPTSTHVSAWHFRPLVLPDLLASPEPGRDD